MSLCKCPMCGGGLQFRKNAELDFYICNYCGKVFSFDNKHKCEEVSVDDIYNIANAFFKKRKYEEAEALFSIVGDYLSAKDKLSMCNEIIKKSNKKKQQKRKMFKTIGSILVVVAILVCIINLYQYHLKPYYSYNKAEKYYKSENYSEAYQCYEKASIKYDDAKYKANECLLKSSHLLFEQFGLSKDNKVFTYVDDKISFVNGWDNIKKLYAYYDIPYTTLAAITQEGKVKFLTDEIEKELNWENIIEISVGNNFVIGLRKDGKIEVFGDNRYGQLDLSRYDDVIDIATGKEHSVILRKSGNVIAVGNTELEYGVSFNSNGTQKTPLDHISHNCDVSNWTDIVQVACGYKHTVGLKADGTVVAVGSNYKKQCNVTNWTDIESIYATDWLTVGLKKDGRIVYTGEPLSLDLDTIKKNMLFK